MKKKLLYLTSIVLFSASSINAQIKVWDFGAEDMGAGYTNMLDVTKMNTVVYSGAAAAGSEATTNLIGSFTVDKIKVLGGGTDRIRTTNPSITRYDGISTTSPLPHPIFNSTATYTPSGYFGSLYFNGKGTSTKWCYTLTLTAGQEVTMICKSYSTSSSTQGTLEVSGPSVVTIPPYPVVANPLGMQEVHFTAGAAGDYIIYDSSSKLQVYRIYFGNVTSTFLANKVFQKELGVVVFAKDSKIFLSNIKSSTKVKVYNVLGALVKSAQADADTSLDINAGVYIVKAKSAEGEKSVKVIVQ